jgi:putative MATE family efflux protein
VIIGLFLSVAMAIPCIVFAEQLVGVFKLDPVTLSQAADFVRIMSLFNVAFSTSMIIGSAMRAAGDTITPLWIGAITNVVNIFLVYSLVYGEFGFPKLGVAGAAIASGIAFSVGALVSVAMWTSGRLVVGFRTRGTAELQRIRQLIHIGYPAGLEQAVWQAGFIGFLWLVALYGTAPYAAYGIGTQILSLSFVVGFGFSIAASTHVGQRLGAGDPDGAARSGWRAVRLSVISMVVLGAVIVALAPTIAGMLIDDPEVVRLTVIFIFILGAVQPLMAIEFTLGGALRGAGDTRFPLYTVLTGLIGVRILLASIAAWLGLSVTWVFAALIADYIVKSSLLLWRFSSGKWQTIQLR